MPQEHILNSGTHTVQNTRPSQDDRFLLEPFPQMDEQQAERFLSDLTGELAQKTKNDKSGSTFTGAIVTGNGNVVTCHLGDSPAAAIVYDPATGSAQAIALTKAHKPGKEFKEFKVGNEHWAESGGRIINSRGDNIALNRALGDVPFGKAVSKNPDIASHDLSQYRRDGKRIFLLVASDGALKKSKGITLEAHANTLAKHLKEAPDVSLSNVAKEITDNSLATNDNITVTLVETVPGRGAVIGLFDGHGGGQTAEAAVKHMAEIVGKIQQGIDHNFERSESVQATEALPAQKSKQIVEDAYEIAVRMMPPGQRARFEDPHEYKKYKSQMDKLQRDFPAQWAKAQHVYEQRAEKFEPTRQLLAALEIIDRDDLEEIKKVVSAISQSLAQSVSTTLGSGQHTR